MQIRRTDTKTTEHVLTVTGDVGAADVVELQACLVEAATEGDADVVLDARGVTSFADSALAALTAGRSRTKSRHHRMAILDGDGGAITVSLHRTGRQFRFPVYGDATAATRGLSADRAALARLGGISDAARAQYSDKVTSPIA
ncbi:MAG TPA: STAS domain-containing protein [Actinomycetales bacterium]|nr:STAS domain-containing protein [Actinomycetales bacterium]